MPQVATVALLNAATATGAGQTHEVWGHERSFHLTGSTSAGAGAASVKVQVSNDGTNFIDLVTLSLVLGTSVVSDGFYSATPWRYVRGNVSSISGTNAAVTLTVGNMPH